MAYQSLAEMFIDVCQKYPDKTGMMYKDKGEYKSITFSEIRDTTFKLAAD